MSNKKRDFSLINFFKNLTTKQAIWIIVILGFVVYSNSLFNDFVWDDLIQVKNNQAIHSLSNIFKFFKGLNFSSVFQTTAKYPFYRPLFVSVLSLLYSMFGSSTFFYHLFQLNLHIINSSLSFLIFRKFFNKTASFLLALVFLVHPINTEAVIYISAMSETLFFLFGALSFLLLVNAEEINRKVLIKSSLLFLATLLSKETGMLFFASAVIYFYLYRRKKLFKIIYSLGLAAAVYLIMRFLLAKVFYFDSITPIMNITFQERLLNIPSIFFYYLKTFFYPAKLSIAQHWIVKSITFGSFYLPLLLTSFFIITTFIFGLYLWNSKSRTFKNYIFFMTLFYIGIGLHLQIIPLDMTVAERWFYFPIIGLLGIIGIFLDKLSNLFYNKNLNNVIFVLSVMILFLLSIRAIVRNSNWKDPLTLYAHDIEYSSSSYDLEINLGIEEFNAKNPQEAKKHFIRATELVPEYWASWHYLAVVYASDGEYEAAENYFKKAIELNNNYDEAYVGYAQLLVATEADLDKVKDFLEESVRKFPGNNKLWFYLAITYYKAGAHNFALEAASKAYSLNPNEENKRIYYGLINNIPLNFE